ncbi:MAG: bacteriohemerythrin [Alphaproteobacteria bacterium]|nr:bacteriohemerythrin [Alphaproteobacteria bacterium]
MMSWTAAMSVGVPELDEDHKKLVGAINALSANAGGADRTTAVRQCLMRLRRYAEFHFAREERVMAACGYPEASGHKEEHTGFIAYVQEVTREFDDDPEDFAAEKAEELLEFLRNWLAHHILIVDMQYRPFAEHNAKARQVAREFKSAEVWWSV